MAIRRLLGLLLVMLVIVALDGFGVRAQSPEGLAWRAYLLQDTTIQRVENGAVVEEMPFPVGADEDFSWEYLVRSPSGRFVQWMSFSFGPDTESYRFRVLDVFTGEVLVDYSDTGQGISFKPLTGLVLERGSINEATGQVALGAVQGMVTGELEVDGEVTEGPFLQSHILIFDFVPGQIAIEPSHRLTPEDDPALSQSYIAYDPASFKGYLPIIEAFTDQRVYWRLTNDVVPYDVHSRWQWDLGTGTVTELDPNTIVPVVTDYHGPSNALLTGGSSVHLLDLAEDTTTELFVGPKQDSVYRGRFVQNGERVLVQASPAVVGGERVYRLLERDGTVLDEFVAPYERVFGVVDGYLYVLLGDPNRLYFVDTRAGAVGDGVLVYEYTGDDYYGGVLLWAGDLVPLAP